MLRRHLSRDSLSVFLFQAEDCIRDSSVTGVQTCALPISKPPCSVDRWVRLRKAKLDGIFPRSADVAWGAVLVSYNGKPSFPTRVADRFLIRYPRIQFRTGRKHHPVKRWRVKLLQGRQYRSLIRDARSDLFTKSFADRSEVLPARRPISLQQVEGNLGVENRLPDRLQGEQPTGLALEFFDSL